MLAMAPDDLIDPEDLLEELAAIIEQLDAYRAAYGSDVALCRGRPLVTVATGDYL